MKCLIITNETGVSLKFNDFIAEGYVILNYEDSNLRLNYPFSNTDFIMLPAAYFKNQGNIELKVISNKITIAKKRIIDYTLQNKV